MPSSLAARRTPSSARSLNGLCKIYRFPDIFLCEKHNTPCSQKEKPAAEWSTDAKTAAILGISLKWLLFF
jgi:hypothetical protein